EVGEEDGFIAEPGVLVGLGLLDLDHQLGRPGVVGRDDGRAGGRVLGVEDRRVLARARLHQHLVPVGDQLAGPVGRERDPVLALLRLARDADDHRAVPPGHDGSSMTTGGAWRVVEYTRWPWPSHLWATLANWSG